MKGWKEKTLADLGYVSRGKSRHRPRNAPELYGGKYPLIQTGDIEAAGFYLTEYNQTYSELGLAQSKLWPKDTLCISIVGANTGASAILKFDACFPDSVIGFIPFEGVSDVRFVKYSLELLRVKLKHISEGAARENLSMEKLLTVKINTPSIEIQRRIASILSAYDDLIENNLRRIKLLEELAQRTYEEWFVRFRFPGFEASNINSDWLPEGWERKKLGEVIDYEIGGGWGNDEPTDEFSASGFVIRGTDMNNLILGKIENVPYRYHKPSNMASRKIQHGDILFEVSGGSSNEGVGKTVLMVDKIIDQFFDDIMCASFCKLVRPISVEYSNYLFLFFQFLRKAKTTEIWEIRSASNIVNYNWTSFLKYQDVIVPDVNTLRKFNSFMDDLVDQIYSLGNQNRLLKESRDILLPRLMSGEIELDELDGLEEGMLMEAEPKGEYKTQNNKAC